MATFEYAEFLYMFIVCSQWFWQGAIDAQSTREFLWALMQRRR